MQSIGLSEELMQSMEDNTNLLSNNAKHKKKRVRSRYGRSINLPGISKNRGYFSAMQNVE